MKKLISLFLSLGLYAGDLPTDVQAKFVKILALNAGAGSKVSCKDSTLLAELTKAGVSPDTGSKVAWASTEAELASLKGKMIICGQVNWLSKGASIALVEEGGKPAIYLHMQNISASGVTLSDAILKIGRRI